MDKRIVKSQRAIYDAFTQVLNEKEYNKITIEDIICKANVSRSTFYSHYKTKDELLNSIIDQMMEHVFSHSLKEEETHDFSKTSIFDYHHFITHILYHLHDEYTLIKAILNNGDCSYVFLEKLKKSIQPIMKTLVAEGFCKKADVPEDVRINTVTESFIILLKHWFDHNCGYNPEKIASCFFELNK